MLSFFRNLPKPTTFPEGQRALFGAALMAGGVACGVGALALTIWFTKAASIFVAHQLTILQILGITLGLAIVMMMIVMVSMAVGGPVGRFKVSATREGASLEAAGDGEPIEPAQITPAQEVIPEYADPE